MIPSNVSENLVELRGIGWLITWSAMNLSTRLKNMYIIRYTFVFRPAASRKFAHKKKQWPKRSMENDQLQNQTSQCLPYQV